jgi:hypothetical protein
VGGGREEGKESGRREEDGREETERVRGKRGRREWDWREGGRRGEEE